MCVRASGSIDGKVVPVAQPGLMTGGVMRPYQVEGMEWIKVQLVHVYTVNIHCTCTCTCMYVHVYMHVHVHVYSSTHVYKCVCVCL